MKEFAWGKDPGGRPAGRPLGDGPASWSASLVARSLPHVATCDVPSPTGLA